MAWVALLKYILDLAAPRRCAFATKQLFYFKIMIDSCLYRVCTVSEGVSVTVHLMCLFLFIAILIIGCFFCYNVLHLCRDRSETLKTSSRGRVPFFFGISRYLGALRINQNDS